MCRLHSSKSALSALSMALLRAFKYITLSLASSKAGTTRGGQGVARGEHSLKQTKLHEKLEVNRVRFGIITSVVSLGVFFFLVYFRNADFFSCGTVCCELLNFQEELELFLSYRNHISDSPLLQSDH